MSRVLNIAENFAEFFDKKVSDIVNATVINPRVYNGSQKIHANNEMFLTSLKITECIESSCKCMPMAFTVFLS